MSLTRYHMDDCVVSIPTGARDISMQMLEWPIGEVDRMGLVVQREQLASSADFDTYVRSETKPYATRFTGYRVEREASDDGTWEGRSVRYIAFRWKKDADVLYHHQAFVFDSGRVLVFTASAKARHRAEVDDLIEAVVQNLAMRED